MKKSMVGLAVAATMFGLLAGCGEETVDESRPVEEIRSELASLDMAAIQ